MAVGPPVQAPGRIALRYRLPPVTTVLVGINAAVYLLMVLRGVSPTDPTIPQLLQWGANAGPRTLNGQLWRMLTSVFLHIGIIHIALNMWCLWELGKLAELIFDRWTYLLTYLACGLGGSLASLFIHPNSVGAGASGAIFGVAGALIAAFKLGHLPIPKQAMQGTLRSLLMFAGYNLFFGAVAPGIDNSAHIGGLITGLAIGAAMAKHLHPRDPGRDARRQWVFAVVALVLLAGTLYRVKTYHLPPQTLPFTQQP
jgi:rhomboid protease GluP